MRFFKGLRFRLILLVLIAVIPALAITAISGSAQVRRARARTLENAYRMTHLVHDYQANLVQNTYQLLQIIANESEIRSPQDCTPFLENLNRTYPAYTTFSVADLGGRVYCTSAASKTVINVADREYFQKTIQERQVTVGAPVVGRLSGKPILPIAIPVYDPSNRMTAVLIASLDLNQVISYAKDLNIPSQSALLMVTKEGTILLRYPATEIWTGKSLPDAPIIHEILLSQREGNTEVAGVDGIPRLYAFTPFSEDAQSPFYISIGIPTTVAYGEPNQLLVTNLLWISLAGLLALAAAWFGGDILFLRVVSLTAERDAAEKKLKEANAELEVRVEERTQELARAVDQLQVELVERQHMVEALHQRGEELKHLNLMLQQSNNDLQDFAFIASHDLQEPLRKIQAFGERLIKHYADNLGEGGVYYAERMRSSANRLQTMINALLSYSRINTRGEKFVPTNLNKVISEVLSDLEITLRETNGKIHVDPLPTIEADPLQTHQLLQNLIGNGLKFHRLNIPPIIQVSIKSQDDCSVTLVVEDNGIGFEEKYLDRIFQPFQRLHSREQFDGNGIGLAICRKIVERHNGLISATSIPGTGSQFIVTLPLKQPQAEEEQERNGKS